MKTHGTYPRTLLLALVASLGLSLSACAPGDSSTPGDGNGERAPIAIAHRGASGYLPEHTLAAYERAHELGADYIEQDVVITRDGTLIVLHDVTLDATTNVAEAFPGRARQDGEYYAIDFDLDEIRTLTVDHRRNESGEYVYPGRVDPDDGLHTVPTLAEAIERIQELDTQTGRTTGIYPEIKRPSWHADEGVDIEEAVLTTLASHGIQGPDANVYVQSFELDSLRTLRNDLLTDVPLVFLTFTADNLTNAELDDYANLVDGIGPWKGLIEADPTLVQRAHDRGLLVHPWTFRADDVGAGYANIEQEIEAFLDTYGVDGIFTDFVDDAVGVIARSDP